MTARTMPPKRKRGLTLVEMLCTIVTLLLMAMLMTTGVKLAADTFTKTISSSHARVLCSNLQTVASDELRFTPSVQLDAQGKVTRFYSGNFSREVNFSTDEDGHVRLGDDAILSANAYPYGLRASVTIDAYDKENRVFTVTICVENAEKTATLASVTFDVKALSDVTVI